jgi:hypothetical protein
MKRLKSSALRAQTKRPRKARAEMRPTIKIAAPDNVRDYALLREKGESAAGYEKRNRLFDKLLSFGGR